MQSEVSLAAGQQLARNAAAITPASEGCRCGAEPLLEASLWLVDAHYAVQSQEVTAERRHLCQQTAQLRVVLERLPSCTLRTRGVGI